MTAGAKFVDACPNCDSTRYRERVSKSPTYVCVCGEAFDDPTRRLDKRYVDTHRTVETSTLPLAEVRDVIRELDLSHVSARTLSGYVDAEQIVIGQALSKLGERGELDVWRRTSNRITWTVVDVEGGI